jgi:hypothetical protein
MTYRSTLADLVTRVRELINDTGTPTWTNDQIAAALDSSRVSHNNEKLRSEQVSLPANVKIYREHFSEFHGWESSAVLRDATGATLTPTLGAGLTDYLLGYFYFSSGQNPPVYIDGKTFDVYAAAAEILEDWMAVHKEEYDFSSAGATYGKKQAALSQVFEQYASMIKEYRSRSKPRSVRLTRSDANARVR